MAVGTDQATQSLSTVGLLEDHFAQKGRLERAIGPELNSRVRGRCCPKYKKASASQARRIFFEDLGGAYNWECLQKK